MLSSEFVQGTLASAPDAMLIVDASGTILFANQQVAALFGYDEPELSGSNVDRLLPPRYRAGHAAHRARFAQEDHQRPMGAARELFALRRDGTEFPVEIGLSPIRDGDRVFVAATLRDISEPKRIERELVLARETADRAREVAVLAREAADQANLGKSRFLATASHDLRQPLQTLALLNGTLRRMVKDADCSEAVALQEQAIGAMSRLLNALLDISKLESGAIKPEPTDFVVAALFDELRADFAGLAANKGLELQIDPCIEYAHSDPSLVEQILRNLLANAIKYTNKGYVRLSCLREATKVRIQVLDTGVGIAPEELPRIYDEFYQVGVAANTAREGYGLGLAIVQRLVKLLELGLRVESRVGQGSTFSLELPTGTSADARQETGPKTGMLTSPACRRAPHVLVVEDDPAVMNATRMLLKVEGYRVTSAVSPADALQVAREHGDIRLLITDYHLNGESTGTDVIASLRTQLGARLPAVLVTGDTSSAIRGLAHDQRVRVISKPMNADQLIEEMRELLAG